MAPRAKNKVLFINVTPNRPKLNGLDLSTIRSHNAYRNQDRRGLAKKQRIPLAEGHPDQADGESREEQVLLTLRNVLLSKIGPAVPSDSLRSDPFDSLPFPATEVVYTSIDHCEWLPFSQVYPTSKGA
jgi:hypothetical protein